MAFLTIPVGGGRWSRILALLSEKRLSAMGRNDRVSRSRADPVRTDRNRHPRLPHIDRCDR
jgi:hypothetical protein